MWIPSRELRGALVSAPQVLENPEGYPKEFVEALAEIAKKKDDSFKDEKMRYRFEGYILRYFGVVGIRLDSSPAVREEWMKHWKMRKANPNIRF